MKVWRWCRKWWWIVVGFAAVAAVVLWRLLAWSGRDEEGPPSILPTVSERARHEVERVRLEADVERARVNATGEAQRTELDAIEAMGRERPEDARRRLAEWLTARL